LVSPVDPAEVRFTGENSYIELRESPDAPFTSRVSHWRALMSAAGPGHVCFVLSELTDDQMRIYSDNPALARWLQEEIEQVLHPHFADQSTPIIEATFTREGDGKTSSTETVSSRNAEISLSWSDLEEPFLIHMQPGVIPGIPYGVYSVLTPARKAQMTINGKAAHGQASPRDLAGHPASTCALAWSETWVRPR